MRYVIANTFTDSLAKLAGEEQRAAGMFGSLAERLRDRRTRRLTS